MNPYLESEIAWHDFHQRVVVLAAGLQGLRVRPHFFVKVIAHAAEEVPGGRRPNHLEIRHGHSQELVTVLELLCPSNKRPGPDREQYLVKRGRILASSAHLVEIDLLRGGEPMPSRGRPDCAYSVMVSRVGERPEAGFWPLGLRDPLPIIPIPLRPPHADATLDLQALLHRVYDEAGYEFYVYQGEPQPPLAPEDAAWAASLVVRP